MADVELRGGHPVDFLLDDALDALLEAVLRLRDSEDSTLRGGSYPKALSRARG